MQFGREEPRNSTNSHLGGLGGVVHQFMGLLNAEALPKHFGAKTQMEDDTREVIHDYALENAPDKCHYKRSRRIAVATPEGAAPPRVTEPCYILRKHHNFPDTMIKGTKGVKSLSLFDKCHTRAANGDYDPDAVPIPNYPDWHD